LHFRDACEDSGFSIPGRWVHSQALRVGDQLCGREGKQVRIRGIVSRQDSLPVYNLSVFGLPYYAVGPIGILVHNSESILRRRPPQVHHPISRPIASALGDHPTLSPLAWRRDEFVTQAADLAAHDGYPKFFRDLDAEVINWINEPEQALATQEEFLAYLRNRYSQPDLRARFPNGF
jgi:hypothetical protein